MSEATKPCPFCGGQLRIFGDFNLERFACETDDCVGQDVNLPAHTPQWRRESLEKWNRRASPDMYTALQCAETVLTLLSAEVEALGCKAGNVIEVVRAALERAVPQHRREE